jgi:hypothetical protein
MTARIPGLILLGRSGDVSQLRAELYTECRFAPDKEESMNGRVYSYRVEGAKYGISFGTALAIAISYSNNHSILWAIVHGFFSWLYVIYFALAY